MSERNMALPRASILVIIPDLTRPGQNPPNESGAPYGTMLDPEIFLRRLWRQYVFRKANFLVKTFRKVR